MIIHLHLHIRPANRPDPPDPGQARVAADRARIAGFAANAHLPRSQQIALWRESADIIRAARAPLPPQRLTGGDAA